METSDKDKDLMGRMEETLRQLGLDGHDMHIASGACRCALPW